MKKAILVTLLILAVGMFAAAQLKYPTSDVLGAHLNYGRGCAACHAPHGGARGNGINPKNGGEVGDIALWGQDVTALWGVTYTTGQSEHGSYTLTLPSNWDTSNPETAGTLTCLSCHDGNYATGAMMKNQVYETVPGTYASQNIPTLLGNDGGPTLGNYLNDHPVGNNAYVGCGGPYNWDCTIVNGAVVPGPKMTEFKANYGIFFSTQPFNGNATVQCTTCHNQHLMNVVNVTASKSGQTPGYYATMFFLRGPYNPASTTAGSNQTAQFCRQCHGGEANEMNGGDTIPTTF